MNTPKSSIQSLHSRYCALTGFQLRLGLGEYQREYGWLQFVTAGFTESDLTLVVTYLKKQISAKARNPGCLKWSNMIGMLDRFEEDLAMAKALSRTKPETPRDKALRDLRPEVTQTTTASSTAKPIGDYIAKLRNAIDL